MIPCLLLLVACIPNDSDPVADEGTSDSEVGTTTDDSTSSVDTTSTREASSSSTSSTDPLAREMCDAYLDCLSEADPVTLASVQPAYGVGGTCFTAGDDALCETACTEGLLDVHDTRPLVPASCRVLPLEDVRVWVEEESERFCPPVVPAFPRSRFGSAQTDCMLDVVYTCGDTPHEDLMDCVGVERDTWMMPSGAYEILGGGGILWVSDAVVPGFDPPERAVWVLDEDGRLDSAGHCWEDTSLGEDALWCDLYVWNHLDDTFGRAPYGLDVLRTDELTWLGPALPTTW